MKQIENEESSLAMSLYRNKREYIRNIHNNIIKKRSDDFGEWMFFWFGVVSMLLYMVAVLIKGPSEDGEYVVYFAGILLFSVTMLLVYSRRSQTKMYEKLLDHVDDFSELGYDVFLEFERSYPNTHATVLHISKIKPNNNCFKITTWYRVQSKEGYNTSKTKTMTLRKYLKDIEKFNSEKDRSLNTQS